MQTPPATAESKGTGLTANLSPDQSIKLALLREGGKGMREILAYRVAHPLATFGAAIDALFSAA